LTTYDLQTGTSDKLYQSHTLDYQVLSRLVDFSLFTGTTYGTAADLAKVITIPTGFLVEEVIYKLIATSSTPTASLFSIGDSSAPQYYFASTQTCTGTAGLLNTIYTMTGGAAGKFKDTTSTATLGASFQKIYTAADYISITQTTTAAQNGKILVIVRGCQLP